MVKTFEMWMNEVDALLEETCGLSSSDLPDVAYYDMYDDGLSPRSAAREALENAGY